MDEVKQALLEERQRQRIKGPCLDRIDGHTNFIFCNRFCHVHPHAINRAVDRIRTACNEWEAAKAANKNWEAVMIPHFSVHNLRHTFCTRFCENKTNIKVIPNISTNMNIYAEPLQEGWHHPALYLLPKFAEYFLALGRKLPFTKPWNVP